MSILEIKGLVKYYGQKPNVIKAVNNVSLCIEKGRFVSIVGHSGSGKTTLLHLIGGLEKPDRGSIVIDGQVIASIDPPGKGGDKMEGRCLREDELTIFRRKNIGFVFQNYNLLPILNIRDNILLPLGLDGREPDIDFFHEVVTCMGLSHRLRDSVRHLSGGEQQRVAIARAIIAKPKLILADEPTGNLDSKTGEKVLSLLLNVGKQFSQTIIMVTHNDEIAKKADDRIYMENGKKINH